MTLEQEVFDILKIKGNTRGENYIISKYVEKKHGKEGVSKLENKISEILKKDFKLPSQRSKEWYPEAMDVSTWLVAKNIFGWTDKDVFELGKFHAVHSFTLRIILRYFVSYQKIFDEANHYWSKYFDFGKLEAVGFNEKNREVMMRIHGYKFHRIMDEFYRGYFYAIANNAFGGNVRVEISKSVFQGDSYNEYIVNW